jgi:23S rRNA (guanosine2251-2'-O)-methyltransferase
MIPRLYVLLDNIRSAYNVGSIFRSCDSAGVDKLYLTGYTAMPPEPKLQKTALGSLDSVVWEHHCQPLSLIKLLRQNGFLIWSCEPISQAVSIFNTPINQDICIILGNEVRGIQSEIISASDAVIKIPQLGIKSSLNVASAAAVIIYECRRQFL